MSEFLSRASLASSFFEDYEALKELSEDERRRVAEFVARYASQDLEDEDLVALRKTITAPGNRFEKVVRVAVYLADEFRRAAHEIQSVQELQDSVAGLFEAEDDVQVLIAILEPSLRQAPEVELASRRRLCLRSGNARIEETYITCDLRPVFRKSAGDEDPKPVILDWMPVATLELVSKLNKTERNHLFLLDRDALLKLKQRIDRALSQLGMLEKARCSLVSARNPTADKPGDKT